MRTLVVMLLAISTPSFAQESSPLIGNWKLVSQQVVVDGAAPQHAFGLNPKGYMILTREGRMMGVITAENRQGGMSDADRAALHKSMFAYSGKYRIEGNDFITAVDVSWNEAWNGTEQRRHFRFEGERLVLETPPAPSQLQPGKTVVARAVWEREK